MFRGQYLSLSLSKRGVPYITKRKKEKGKCKKKSRTKQKKSEVRLSDFTKAENLSVFTRAEN
jgi:hypothetical protein